MTVQFYLPLLAGKVIDIEDLRSRAYARGITRGGEVSRGRGDRAFQWTVTCSPDVAAIVEADLLAMSQSADSQAARDACTQGLAAVRAEVARSAAASTRADQLSDKARGQIGS